MNIWICRALFYGLLLIHHSVVWGLPTGGTAVSGITSITPDPTTQTMTITSNAARSHVTFDHYNVAVGETVRYNQPDVNSIVYNEITGGRLAEIRGKIISNGSVIFENPAGILFTKDARVDVAGLLATTASMQDIQSFLNGANQVTFVQNPLPSHVGPGKVKNHGTINIINNEANNAGIGALFLAPRVKNEGSIIATYKTVNLSSNAYQPTAVVSFTGDGMINFTLAENDTANFAKEENFLKQIVDKKEVISNKEDGHITAKKVIIQVGTAQQIINANINLEGTVQVTDQITIQMGTGLKACGGNYNILARGVQKVRKQHKRQKLQKLQFPLNQAPQQLLVQNQQQLPQVQEQQLPQPQQLPEGEQLPQVEQQLPQVHQQTQRHRQRALERARQHGVRRIQQTAQQVQAQQQARLQQQPQQQPAPQVQQQQPPPVQQQVQQQQIPLPVVVQNQPQQQLPQVQAPPQVQLQQQAQQQPQQMQYLQQQIALQHIQQQLPQVRQLQAQQQIELQRSPKVQQQKIQQTQQKPNADIHLKKDVNDLNHVRIGRKLFYEDIVDYGKKNTNNKNHINDQNHEKYFMHAFLMTMICCLLAFLHSREKRILRRIFKMIQASLFNPFVGLQKPLKQFPENVGDRL